MLFAATTPRPSRSAPESAADLFRRLGVGKPANSRDSAAAVDQPHSLAHALLPDLASAGDPELLHRHVEGDTLWMDHPTTFDIDYEFFSVSIAALGECHLIGMLQVMMTRPSLNARDAKFIAERNLVFFGLHQHRSLYAAVRKTKQLFQISNYLRRAGFPMAIQVSTNPKSGVFSSSAKIYHVPLTVLRDALDSAGVRSVGFLSFARQEPLASWMDLSLPLLLSSVDISAAADPSFRPEVVLDCSSVDATRAHAADVEGPLCGPTTVRLGSKHASNKFSNTLSEETGWYATLRPMFRPLSADGLGPVPDSGSLEFAPARSKKNHKRGDDDDGGDNSRALPILSGDDQRVGSLHSIIVYPYVKHAAQALVGTNLFGLRTQPSVSSVQRCFEKVSDAGRLLRQLRGFKSKNCTNEWSDVRLYSPSLSSSHTFTRHSLFQSFAFTHTHTISLLFSLSSR